MALNFTVSYTFSPSTTISSSQVNTNTSDVANVFTGLEAETKTLAKLKVDIDPTLALEVATKQYVDHYSAYRRPVLQYSSGTVANIETGIDGTSGEAQILFPDGNLRQDSTTGRINCNLAQVAALSGAWQSGLRTGTVANNTWYAVYAVKTTDNSLHFVTVADTVLPLQANYATLNSNFGTSGWVYLGLIRYGDNSGVANAILTFVQAGNTTCFRNGAAGNGNNSHGINLATTASAATLTYTYAAGTGAAQIPANITIVNYLATSGSVTGAITMNNSGSSITYQSGPATNTALNTASAFVGATEGVLVGGTTSTHDIYLTAFIDGVLGVGSNPIL